MLTNAWQDSILSVMTDGRVRKIHQDQLDVPFFSFHFPQSHSALGYVHEAIIKRALRLQQHGSLLFIKAGLNLKNIDGTRKRDELIRDNLKFENAIESNGIHSNGHSISILKRSNRITSARHRHNLENQVATNLFGH